MPLLAGLAAGVAAWVGLPHRARAEVIDLHEVILSGYGQWLTVDPIDAPGDFGPTGWAAGAAMHFTLVNLADSQMTSWALAGGLQATYARQVGEGDGASLDGHEIHVGIFSQVMFALSDDFGAPWLCFRADYGGGYAFGETRAAGAAESVARGAGSFQVGALLALRARLNPHVWVEAGPSLRLSFNELPGELFGAGDDGPTGLLLGVGGQLGIMYTWDRYMR